MKHTYIGILAAAALLLSACVREEPFGAGDDGLVHFRVSTEYDNGEPDADQQTKTVYSGDRISLTYSDSTQRYERIDWVDGDAVKIHCKQALSPNGEAVIYAVSGSATASGKNSTAAATPASGAPGDGFTWAGADVSHHFFAVYPESLTPFVGTGISGDTGDDIATVSASIPQSQKPVRVENGDVTEYVPDMRNLAMVAYSQRLGAAKEVPLYFKPIASAVRFTLLGDADDEVTKEGSGYLLTRLRLISSAENQGEVKAPILFGNYTVAFGKYSTHMSIAPTYADPSDPSSIVTPGVEKTFNGRGINDGMHDVDGEDNAIALLSADELTDAQIAAGENYIDIPLDSFIGGGVALSETKPAAFTFICLPTTQTHLSLVLTFEKGGDTKTRTLKLQHNSSWIHLKEHCKTYFDAIPVRRPEYILKVVPKDFGDFPTTATEESAYFTVVSYYDKTTQEAVKWTATFSEEGDLPDKYKATPPSWLNSFYDTATGSEGTLQYDRVDGNLESAPKSFTVGVKVNAATSWELAAPAENPGDGQGATTMEKAPDLSYRDVYGKTQGTQETANCYVVSGRGFYKFPVIYGNAIMNGVKNSAAYTGKTATLPEYASNILSTYLRHDGNAIAGPWITTDNGVGITKAELVWQDNAGLVQNVSYENNYIYFNVVNSAEGNAVIAAYAGDTIVWSWHIWCIHNPDTALATVCLEPNPLFVTDVDHNHVMHTNLGFTRSGNSSADERVCHVRFQQVDDAGNVIPEGRTTYLIISQLGSEAGSDVPFYQWGRKDPMFPSRLASSSPVTVRNARIFDKDGNDKYGSTPNSNLYPNPQKGSIPSGTNGVAYAIQNPEKMLMGPNGVPKTQPFRSWAGEDVYFNLWNSNVTQPVRRYSPDTNDLDKNDDGNFARKDVVVRKTVYDPCPPGFCIPNEYAFSIFNLWTSNKTGGFYPGGVRNINAVGGTDAGKWSSFDSNLGYTFYTTADGEGHTHGRVFMRAVGRRNGNGDNASAVPNLSGTPQDAPQQTSAEGTYWTAAPYLFIGDNKQ